MMVHGLRSSSSLVALLALSTLVSCNRDGTKKQAPSPAQKSQTATRAPKKHLQDLDNPDLCLGCHTAIVSEWKSSFHASAHHEADPIYGAMRTLRMKKEGDEIAQKCAGCHGPRAPSEPDSKLARTGISCTTCHMVENVDRAGGKKKGAAALTFHESAMRGIHEPKTPHVAPHERGPAAPWLLDGETLCLACHDAMQNPEGVATCTTGTEYAQKSDKQTCTNCHMPEVAGPGFPGSPKDKHRSHAFLGPHQLFSEPPSADFMASALRIEGRLAGGLVSVQLENKTAHSVPSGFPGRMLLVQVKAFDESDKLVWTNFQDDPMSEDPKAVLNKIYVDADGKPTMPPYAKELKKDSRLSPDETRTLEWKVPEAVHHVDVEVFYRLLPPAAVGTLGLMGAPVAAARPVTKLRVEAVIPTAK